MGVSVLRSQEWRGEVRVTSLATKALIKIMFCQNNLIAMTIVVLFMFLFIVCIGKNRIP